MTRYTSKVALITGGSSGMGLATAQRLISDGARVVITGRGRARLDAATKALGERAFGIVADAANLADLDALMHTIRQRYGRLDVVFANAGVGVFNPPPRSPNATSITQWMSTSRACFSPSKRRSKDVESYIDRQCAGVVRDYAAQLTMNQDGLQDRILAAICQATPDQAARHCYVEGHQLGQAELWMSILPLG